MSKYKNYNWKEIQNYYDEGHSWNDLIKEFSINIAAITYAKKNNLFKSRTSGESISISQKGRKHSEETRKKISEGRIKYLKENPDKVPYLLNHSSKLSYPEKYFKKLFKKEKINVEEKFRIGLYELDFSIPEKRIDIEIDGEQHYSDEKIIKSDIKRNKFLEDNGWDIIRIRWRFYKTLNKEEKEIYIKKLINYINNLSDDKPTIKIIDKKVCKCGRKKDRKSKSCHYCHSFNQRKVKRPNYETLINEVKENGYSATGKKYGVVGNTIKKWIKAYENNLVSVKASGTDS